MTDRLPKDAFVDFRPPAWLVNPHVQSILPSLPLRRSTAGRRSGGLLAVSVPEVIDCGEGVRLLAQRATPERLGRAPASRLAVLLHGWEGSADSLYVLSLGQQLLDRGFEVVRLNLRDHGESHHLNQEIFHSCRIAEVVGAVQRLQALNPGQGLNLVGFSLGGNFCLRVGARAAAAGLRLEHLHEFPCSPAPFWDWMVQDEDRWWWLPDGKGGRRRDLPFTYSLRATRPAGPGG